MEAKLLLGLIMDINVDVLLKLLILILLNVNLATYLDIGIKQL